MSDVAEKVARFKPLRDALLVGVALPLALLAGCAPQPAPPPPPASYAAPAPPPTPAPPAVPVVRG